MFRYLLLKLPSFTSKTDFPVSPTCNKTSILRPTSPVKREYRREAKRGDDAIRPIQKRSYSFPSTRARNSNLFDSESRYGKWEKCDLPENQGLNTPRNDTQSSRRNSRTLKKLNPESAEKRTTYSPNDVKRLGEQLPSYKKINKSEDVDFSFESKERYELEAARPKRNRSEAMFDVFDYVAKNGNDPVRYLQPNKLRPFGSNDNIYLPLLMATKTSDLDDIPQSLSTSSFKRSSTPTRGNKESNDVHRRSYSTLYKENKHKYATKKVKSSNTIVDKHKDINPLYISKKLSSNDVNDHGNVKEASDNQRRKSTDNLLKPCNKTVEESLVCKMDKESAADLFQSYRSSWNEPRIRIDPSPFLQCDEKAINLSSDASSKPKKSPSDMSPLKAPWPAYSERVKRNAQKCASEPDLVKENLQPNILHPQKRTISTENIIRTESKQDVRQLCKQKESLISDFSQKRSLSSKDIAPHDSSLEKTQASGQIEKIFTDIPQKRSVSSHQIRPNTTMQTSSKRCRSSTAVSNTSTIPIPTVGTKEINMDIKKSYARSCKSKKPRAFEPEPCGNEGPKTKYFLPSKVRLSPPRCLQKPPYRGCIKEDPCPPRADQCLKIVPKKLPVLEANKCPCVEPYVPTKDPKVRRLQLKFEDPPRICPCNPCPCPPRADDSLTPKKKKLLPYVPGNCACVEPPPMIDVPLIKLKKICEPEAKCYPPKPCPQEEPCVRADDNRVECPKPLPPLQASDCPCVEPYVPNANPQLRRLKMEFRDPERICPCEPNCPCPPRADDFLKEKPRKLPIYKPGNCECVEPPPMIDVPLKRLKKVCTPEVCDPQKFCPVIRCEDNPRADDKLKVKTKKLPVLEISNCKCIEPEVPDKIPKLRRLKMKFADDPRICPCEPNCPCPPRADDSLKPKPRKLLPYVPGYCKCVEPSPLVDVPLIPLKKICEPEAKCYPPKPCPKEPPCVRADGDLCARKKKLPPLETNKCPCVDIPPPVDAPKLKRLTLNVPEPPRPCPIPDPCLRADDNLKDKIRKLPLLPPGACPCVDLKPPEDIKPLKRLKCEDEEPGPVCDDPCIPFPRADWGCWEYTQCVEKPEAEIKCKKGKKNTVNYNTKRKFNTDTRAIVQKTSSELFPREGPPDNADIIAVKSKQEVNFSLPDMVKLGSDAQTAKSAVELTTSLPEKLFKTLVRKNKSQPTLTLLRKLNELETNRSVGARNSFDANRVRIMDIKTVLNKIFSRAHLHQQSFMNKNDVKELCTSAVRQTENINRPVSTAHALFSPKGTGSKKKSKDKCSGKPKEKCPKGPCPTMILKGCAQKSPKGCEKERTPVCCEKKPSPYPAFSEAMDEEVEPYSKVTQWTCNKKQYGFHPHPKKFDEPLDTVRNKKKFSTSSSVIDSHPSESDRMQDLGLRPKTGNGSRQMSGSNSVSPRASSKHGGGSNVNTVNPERSESVAKGRRNLSKASSKSIVEKDLLVKRPNTSGELNTILMENKKTRTQFRTYGNYTPQEKRRLLGDIGVQSAPKCCGKMPRRGYSTLQSNNSSVQYPLTNEAITQNIVLMNKLSSATANTSKTIVLPEFHNQFHRSESNFKNNKNSNSGKKSSCKGKPCGKLKLENCPPKQRESCKTHRPVICKKPKAPYPAFTDCMDDEMEDKITECPLVKERNLRIQPKHMNELPKLPILEPVQPYQGKLDPKLEEDCIRDKLKMKNEGLTQCCSEFGKFVKPMRSKDYIKRTNRDCKKIEELKKAGKWPPKNSKGFCTRTTSFFDIQRRELSTLPSTYSISSCILDANTNDLTRSELYKSDMFTSNPTRSREESLKSKRVYVRNYDTLFNPEHKVAESIKEKSVALLQNQCEDSNEMCKYVKLKNIQWRINNFQKWCRLNKLSNLPTPIKRFHSCSKVKYKRYTKCISNSNNFSTSSIKCASTNENSDVCIQRGISTTMILSRAASENEMGGGRRKPNKFAIVSKGRTARKCPKFRLPNCPPRVRTTCERKREDRPCTKVVTPNPAFSECYDEEAIHPISECPLERERFQRLQPQYPMLPEIGTISLPPPHQGRIDYSLEEDYIRLKLGIKNEGLTQDCQTFGQPVKVLKCKNYTNSEYMSRGKANQCLANRRERDRCSQRNPCKAPKEPCPSTMSRSMKYDSLWQRIVNYFKARPNCPSPDEWKKRALREKAEKAARAAGLCLCEPKDMPKRICVEELPKVITPKIACPPLRDEEDDDSCDEGDTRAMNKSCNTSSRNRCGKLSNPRKCFSTTPMATTNDECCALAPRTWCPILKDEEDDSCDEGDTSAVKRNSRTSSNETSGRLSNPKRCFGTISMRNSNSEHYPLILRTSNPIVTDEEYCGSCDERDTSVRQLKYKDTNAFRKELNKLDGTCTRGIKCKASFFDNTRHTLSTRKYLSTITNSNKIIASQNACVTIRNDMNYSHKEENARLLKGDKSNSSDSGKCRTPSNTRGCLNAVSKRCYSSNVGWKNLEEINKTIEEEEKKKLAKKMSSCPNEDVQFMNDVNNFTDDGMYYNFDTSYEEIFNEAILSKNEENDITKYMELDDNESIKDSPLNFALQIVPPEHNLVEIIFNEPADELYNYSQANAFAVFQDYFNNIEKFSELSYEDIEKAKTNNLLKELDKLLEDKEETNKEN